MNLEDGGTTGSGTTTVLADNADAKPPLFEADTTTRRENPTSPDDTT